eukprot:6460038-Amphidinium_carterae.1
MPLKYTRDGGSISLQAVQRVKRELCAPEPLHGGDAKARSRSPPLSSSESSHSTLDEETLYFVHRDANFKTYSYKVHVSSVTDSEALACGSLDAAQCEVLGRCRPLARNVCKRCVKARPDLWPEVEL